MTKPATLPGLAAISLAGLLFATLPPPLAFADRTPSPQAALFTPTAHPTGAPAATPAATPTPDLATPLTPVPDTAGAAAYYTVREDDTLWAIAGRFGLDLDTLIAINHIADPDLVQPGDRILIDPAVTPPSPHATAAPATPEPTSPPEPAAAPPTTPALTPAPTGTPLLTGTHQACPATTTAHPLDLPADPIRLAIYGNSLYLIAAGELYRLTLPDDPIAPLPAPERISPADRRVGRTYIQELVSLALDINSGDLYLLDKSNDVFRRSAHGKWSLPYPAMAVPGQFPDPQFLAIQPGDDGDVFALDADLSTIWRLSGGKTPPTVFWSSPRLLDARDLLRFPNDDSSTFYFLLENGSVARLAHGNFSVLHDARTDPGVRPWPAQLLATTDGIAAVNAQERSVVTLDPAGGARLSALTVDLPALPRLRSVAQRGTVLYAVAGPTLYTVDLSTLAPDSTCAPAAFDNTLYFRGADIETLLPEHGSPFPGAWLPDRPRSYPGARRLYRHGVHEGVDLYGTDAPGVGYGSPVLAIAPGTVTRADTDFVDMTPSEYDAAIARTEREHRTSPDLADAFLGRQVRIAHGDRVESGYSHLHAVAPGLEPGASVALGDPVGRVGVSGTSAGVYGTQEGAHLHFEVWVDGHYLGEGLSLYETMRLWQAIFNR